MKTRFGACSECPLFVLAFGRLWTQVAFWVRGALNLVRCDELGHPDRAPGLVPSIILDPTCLRTFV